MRRCTILAMAFLISMWLTATAAHSQGAAVDLLSGLQTGQIWAEFRGAGDAAVTGVIGRYGQGPQEVVIASGTQFYAQFPGIQGMSAIGSRRVDLGQQQVASVTVPTACTHIALRPPTPDDLMLPASCPDERLASLATVFDRHWAPHPAAQLAVWAVANNPPPWLIASYLQQVFPGEDSGAAEIRWQFFSMAADLLREAGLEPAQFAMFW